MLWADPIASMWLFKSRVPRHIEPDRDAAESECRDQHRAVSAVSLVSAERVVVLQRA